MPPMNSPPGSRPQSGRRRRGSRRGEPALQPLQVLAQARAVPTSGTPAEVPLTPAEVTRFKAHLRFLRDHKKVLKLRLNAAEDLLINGVREPTHRGVCQHLLDKVERNRVLSASQTLPAAEAVRLLGGIIRFAPEIPYIVRFLECVQQTSSQAQAGAAVTEALKQIRFGDVSAAQMRQIIALIVEVFAERELPVFFLTLLFDAPFRNAFDRSQEGFPEVLARMVVPLRAVYEVLTHRSGPGNRGRDREPTAEVDPLTLEQGLRLLLDVSPTSLVELAEPIRRRLLGMGQSILRWRPDLRPEGLLAIHKSLPFSDLGERRAAGLALCSALLGAGQYRTAKRLLSELRAEPGADPRLSELSLALDAPRVGPIALHVPHEAPGNPPAAPPRSEGRRPAMGRWVRGWHLPSQTPVLLRQGEPGEQARYAEQHERWRRLLVPGVSRVVAFGLTDDRSPYLAVTLPGTSLTRDLNRGARNGEGTRLGWVLELVALFSAVARDGMVLPDGDLHRFNSDPEGHLWLVDCWGLSPEEPVGAGNVHLAFAKQASLRILSLAPIHSLTTGWSERIEGARDFYALASILQPATLHD